MSGKAQGRLPSTGFSPAGLSLDLLTSRLILLEVTGVHFTAPGFALGALQQEQPGFRSSGWVNPAGTLIWARQRQVGLGDQG